MGALVRTDPARDGALIAPASVSATDTISRAVLGARGCNLEIINGNASANVVTVSDATTTRSGAAAAPISRSVAAGTSRIFRIIPQQADPVTKVVTITNSVPATNTYKLTPIG